jgi:anti-sigma factor RsiW
MNCKLKPTKDFLDDYILGRLSVSETESFEEHFFECDECSESLYLRRQILESFEESKRPIAQRRYGQKLNKNRALIKKIT